VSPGVLADSGPLYAAADPEDQYHARAHEELAMLAAREIPILIPFPILCESHSLVLRRLGATVATTFLADVLSGALVTHPTGNDCVDAFALASGYPDQQITLFDAVTAAMSDRLSQPVWTYDHHFDVMGAAVWR
jgi:predicted nucleic acid-binding protein